MKKRFALKSVCFLLTFIMFFGTVLTPPEDVGAVPASPKGNVETRIESLRALYPDGSYFSVNGKACTHGTLGTCNNCSLSGNMKKMGYNQTQKMVQGWTCVAFARFAFFYIFGIPYDVLMYNNKAPTGTKLIKKSQALPGDLFVWNNKHVAVYLGGNKFYHSNVGSPNRVSYGSGYSGTPSYIIRANNYNTINSAVVRGNFLPKVIGAVWKGNTLKVGEVLAKNEFLMSTNRKFIALMQPDGNFVLYSSGLAYWNTFTGYNDGAYAKISTSGNIVIGNSSGTDIWNAGVKNAVRLVMRNNGNLSALDSSGKEVWTSETLNKGGNLFFATKADNIGNNFSSLVVSGNILTNNAPDAVMETENFSETQIMRFIRNADDRTYHIASPDGGFALTAESKARNGSVVRFAEFTGNDSQRFRIEKFGSRFMISPQNSPQMVITNAPAAAGANGETQLQLFPRDNTAPQWFEIRSIPDPRAYFSKLDPPDPPAYSVVFLNNGNPVSVQTVTRGNSPSTPVLPAKKGYTRKWDRSFRNISGNTTVNVEWKIRTYRIRFKDKSKVIKEVRVDYNTRVREVKAPKKAGFTFAGWYTGSRFKQKFNFKSRISSNKNIYARYVKTPSSPSGIRTRKLGTGKLQLSWRAFSGYVYEIESSTIRSSSGFKRIKRTSGSSFTARNLGEGQTYFFRLRRYKRVGGVRIYSKYSAKIRVKG